MLKINFMALLQTLLARQSKNTLKSITLPGKLCNKRSTISTIIITKNAAKYLKQCLAAVLWTDEIIVALLRSLLITSNLPFSQWNNIFKDQMTTNAAIDRLVHHSVILELNASSYRAKCAKNNIIKSSKKNVAIDDNKEGLMT